MYVRADRKVTLKLTETGGAQTNYHTSHNRSRHPYNFEITQAEEALEGFLSRRREISRAKSRITGAGDGRFMVEG
jgi:hypothetical protein